eukprot:1031577-Prymnesium_polylepis.1
MGAGHTHLNTNTRPSTGRCGVRAATCARPQVGAVALDRIRLNTKAVPIGAGGRAGVAHADAGGIHRAEGAAQHWNDPAKIIGALPRRSNRSPWHSLDQRCCKSEESRLAQLPALEPNGNLVVNIGRSLLEALRRRIDDGLEIQSCPRTTSIKYAGEFMTRQEMHAKALRLSNVSSQRLRVVCPRQRV